uniref:Uncharacterized protein n=1 Tax=Arundo donax TaxID=35708 RepID=A0A0A9F954_ARUDO
MLMVGHSPREMVEGEEQPSSSVARMRGYDQFVSIPSRRLSPFGSLIQRLLHQTQLPRSQSSPTLSMPQ